MSNLVSGSGIVHSVQSQPANVLHAFGANNKFIEETISQYEGIEKQVLRSLKEDLNLKESDFEKVCAIEEVLERAVLVSEISSQQEKLLSFYLGREAAEMESILSSKQYEALISIKFGKINKENAVRRKLRKCKNLYFAVCYGIATLSEQEQRDISVEEFFAHPVWGEISEKAWALLGSSSYPAVAFDAANQLISNGMALKEYQLEAARRIKFGGDITVAEKRAIAADALLAAENNKNKRKKSDQPQVQEQPARQQQDIEILDSEILDSSFTDKLNESDNQKHLLETIDFLSQENTILKDRVKELEKENHELKQKLQSRFESEEEPRHEEQQEQQEQQEEQENSQTSLVELRKFISESESIIDLSEIAKSQQISLPVEILRDKQAVKQHILENLPEVFEEDFAEV